MKLPSLKPQTVAILAGAGVVLYLALRFGSAAKQAAADAAQVGGGLLTGENIITGTARTDAYHGAGVLGTLGAAADQMSGGTLSKLGEWLGGKAADWTGN